MFKSAILKRVRPSYSNLHFIFRNICVRFAPSPTGNLHLGGLRTALYNYLFAKKHQGRFILRIEDTDQARVVPGAVEGLEKILKWIGLDPSEGPSQGGSYGPYLQSERLKLYNESVQQLLDNGSAYRCFCTESRLALVRKEALRLRQVPKYDNRCKYLKKEEVNEFLKKGKSHVVRFSLTEGPIDFHDIVYGPISINISKLEGDPIILKSDKYPTYHLACVVDDHYMEVSHVLRGVEWQVSTPKHLMMYKAFGWDPPKFAHLPLIMNKDGTKLSKRQNDIHVDAIKNKGYYPKAILNFSTIMGGGFGEYTEKLFTMDEMVNMFSLENINVNSCKMELERLDYFNKKVLNELIEDENQINKVIKELCFKVKEKFPTCDSNMLSDEKLTEVLLWSRGQIITVNDFLGDKFAFLWLKPDWSTNKPKIRDPEMAKDLLIEVLGLLTNFNGSTFSNQIQSFSERKKYKFSESMRVVRVGLIGRIEGPGIVDLINILGVPICTKRLIDLQQHLDSFL